MTEASAETNGDAHQFECRSDIRHLADSSVYEAREFFASSRCLKLANCLRFDLADALSRYLENMTNLFERVAIAITETVSEFNDFSLTIRKALEDF